VIFRELLKEKSQFPQRISLHEMSVINEGHDHFTILIELVNLKQEPFFTLVDSHFDVVCAKRSLVPLAG